jgi:hypothetical protein
MRYALYATCDSVIQTGACRGLCGDAERTGTGRYQGQREKGGFEAPALNDKSNPIEVVVSHAAGEQEFPSVTQGRTRSRFAKRAGLRCGIQAPHGQGKPHCEPAIGPFEEQSDGAFARLRYFSCPHAVQLDSSRLRRSGVLHRELACGRPASFASMKQLTELGLFETEGPLFSRHHGWPVNVLVTKEAQFGQQRRGSSEIFPGAV